MRLLYIFGLFIVLTWAEGDDPVTTNATEPALTSTTTTTTTLPTTESSNESSPANETAAASLPTTTASPAASTSSSEASSTSTSASTTTKGPTTLPNVPVEYVEFKRSCTVDGDCEYTLIAPHNDQKFLATEKSLVDNDYNEVSNISDKIQQFQKTIADSTGDAQKKMQQLAQRLQKAQMLLDLYQSQLQQIKSDLDETEYQLQFPNLYINTLKYNPQQCYAKCLIPPTTTPAPTTPTPGPTTTPSPCKKYECHNGATECETDSSNTPHCLCPGNLDGYQHCDTGACSDAGILITTNSSITNPFYSPGFYGPDSNNFTAPPKDIVCSWTLQTSTGQGGYNATNFDFTKLDTTTSSLIFYTPNGAEVRATNQFSQKKLDSVLSQSPITVEFRADGGSTSSFFFDMIEL
uniref:CUB domain-containing protein n=1 Tax=Haemonchus contortus TaxID=6289 RepID=A0A7I4YCH4_HAECO